MFTVFAAEEFNPHTVCQSTPCQGKNTDILSFYSWKPVSHYRVTVLVTCKVLQKKPKRIGELMRLIHYQLITVFSLYQSRIQNSFSLHYSLEEFNKILDVRCKLGDHQQAYRYVVMLLIIAVILRFRFRREIIPKYVFLRFLSPRVIYCCTYPWAAIIFSSVCYHEPMLAVWTVRHGVFGYPVVKHGLALSRNTC